MAYLLARFPVGLVTFSARSSTFAAAGYLLTAPISAPFDGVELGIWEPDTWYEGLALVPAGRPLLVASGWISEGMAAVSRELARWGVR